MARKDKFRKKLKKLLPVVTVTLTGLPFALWTPPAQAFFPPVFPGSPPVTVVPPVSPPPLVVPPVVVPPVSPPPIIVPPVSPPPIVIPPVSPPPITTTPEPATLAGGLIGLAAVAGYRRLKRRKAE